MKREHEDLLMRALGDELNPEQQVELARLLSADADLRAEWESLQRTRQLLSSTAAADFEPFFATRVMARVDQRRESLADCLVRLFRPLVPAAVAVALLLSVLNWRSGELMGEGASILEVAFGMPAVSVETAELLDL
jgi:anti-sigma factor RsiW